MRGEAGKEGLTSIDKNDKQLRLSDFMHNQTPLKTTKPITVGEFERNNTTPPIDKQTSKFCDDFRLFCLIYREMSFQDFLIMCRKMTFMMIDKCVCDATHHANQDASADFFGFFPRSFACDYGSSATSSSILDPSVT
jgi:hypothetical protein